MGTDLSSQTGKTLLERRTLGEKVMNRVTLAIAMILTLAGFIATAGVSAALAAGEQAAFIASVDKSLKISGQMASGKVPYNPGRAVKAMKNISKAVAIFEKSGMAGAPKKVTDCATGLKAASAKGAVAAKAGQGAFKAVYGDLVKSFKDCK